MLKITFLEFIMRGVPEGFIFLFSVYAFTNNKIQTKRYLISALLQSIIVYIMRFLPINSGVDTILNLIVLIVIMITISKFEVIQSIKAGIIAMLCEFICEGINVFFLQSILKKDLNSLFKDPVLKIIYSSPSLILFSIIVMAYYIIKKKRDEQYIVWKS